MQKRLPSNVARFEALMYASQGVGALVSILRWNRSVAKASAGFVVFVEGGAFAYIVLFVWLIARRQKNWARWLFLILGLLGLPLYFRTLRQILRFNPLAGSFCIVQFLLELVAMLLIFTGNARNWFKQPASAVPTDDAVPT